jgi:hypothetical protein
MPLSTVSNNYPFDPSASGDVNVFYIQGQRRLKYLVGVKAHCLEVGST